MNKLKLLQDALLGAVNQEKQEVFQRFFKTAPGQYGAGDIFLGLSVPLQRQLAKKYCPLPFSDLKKLIRDKRHEFRLVALLLLVEMYSRALSFSERRQIVDFYLQEKAGINNWDLVDLSVYKILGDFLLASSKSREAWAIKPWPLLEELSSSAVLWDRRLAMVSTYAFIKDGQTAYTYRLAKKLIKDKEDLMHKAVGWMLREAGKRVSEKELEDFLKKEGKNLPRTALRYAIERLPAPRRAYFLAL